MAVEIIYETHSLTTDNEAGAATGWLPGQLSESGRRLARELGERHRQPEISAVFHSDLARSVETATTCTADLQIFTTTIGDVGTAGPITFFRDSGTGGICTSGLLAGYQLSGTQDIMLNTKTGLSQLHGSFTATGPDGTLTIRYNGHADTTTGAATGNFVTAGGTGAFADFHWSGSITAQQLVVGVPFFNATDTGSCYGLP